MPNCVSCGKEVSDGIKMCEGCSQAFGTFGKGQSNINNAEIFFTRKKEDNKEREPSVSGSLVEKYKLFQESLNPECKVVYYPSCDTDSSPSKAFEKSRVIYVDINNTAVDVLKKAGLEAHTADANEYVPDEPVDVLILLNPAGTSLAPSKHVKEGGYILCNDYHKTATQLRESDDFNLIGLVRKEKDNQVFDSENLEEYWEKVSSDDELKKQLEYSYFLKLLTMAIGKEDATKAMETGTVVKEYAKLLEGAEKDGTRDGFMGLPRKKGHMDDIFIFVKDTKIYNNQMS